LGAVATRRGPDPGVEPLAADRHAAPPSKPRDPLEADLTPSPMETPDPGKSLREREQAALGELAEVERALAVLEDRSPDAAVSVAYAKMLAGARRRELRKVLAATQHALAVRRRWRILGLVGVGAVIFLVGVGGGRVATIVRAHLAARAHAVEAAEHAADPFRAAGFAVRELRSDGAPRAVDVPLDTCMAAVAGAAGGPARVRIERGRSFVEADGSAGFCVCAAERVTIEASGPGSIEVRVLATPAGTFGGVDRLAAVEPRPAAMLTEPSDRACADTAFDDWAKGAPVGTAPASLSPDEQVLARQGLAPVAHAPADRRFVLVPPRSTSCWLAASRAREDALSLRLRGGERVAATRGTAVGFCAADSAGLSVWREGRGVVTLFEAPRDRAGGVLGIREAAARAGLRVRTWVPSAELEADARAALVASGLGALVDAGDGVPGPLLAMSTDARSTFSPTDVGIEAACVPAPELGVMQTICAEAAPNAVGRGGLPSATVRSRRPLWLPAPADSSLPDLERTLVVLGFARRMSLLGYELSVLTGATATATGARVTGRSGEHEVVSIAVDSAPPFVHTLAASEAWTLGSEPRPVPLAPGESVELRADPPYGRAAVRREILVWRR
jgi:hypothetical protein